MMTPFDVGKDNRKPSQGFSFRVYVNEGGSGLAIAILTKMNVFV